MSTAAGAMEAPSVVEPALEQPAPAEDEEGGYRLGWTEYAIVAAIALVVSTAVFAAGWMLFGKQAAVKVGVIDLPSIVEIEELSLTLSMMGSKVTDDDRAVAYERVKGYGHRLEVAIEQARKECGCILLTRNAMVGQSAADQTARVKDLLGIGGINAAELREKIAKNVQAIPEGAKR